MIGITERGDAALDTRWLPWVRKGKPTILITKDPRKLYDILRMEAEPFNIIVHCTITGLGGTVLEPNVPPFKEALKAYRSLIDYLELERVVLRVDPVIPTDGGIYVAQKVFIEVADIQGRRRISFIDQYDHVKERLKKAGTPLPWNDFHAPLKIRQAAWEALGRPETCGEPDFPCCGCVSKKDCEILKIVPQEMSKGQRTFCSCLAEKHELLSNRKPCPHQCLYCYWKS